MSHAFPDLPVKFYWHNPHNVTPEQVGDGYRLLVSKEIDANYDYSSPLFMAFQYWRPGKKAWENCPAQHMTSKLMTYRVRKDVFPLENYLPKTARIPVFLSKEEIRVMMAALVTYQSRQTAHALRTRHTHPRSAEVNKRRGADAKKLRDFLYTTLERTLNKKHDHAE